MTLNWKDQEINFKLVIGGLLYFMVINWCKSAKQSHSKNIGFSCKENQKVESTVNNELAEIYLTYVCKFWTFLRLWQ